MERVDDVVPDHVYQAVMQVLAEQLGPAQLEQVDVRVGQDHDGDSVIFVDVYHTLTEAAFEPRQIYRLTRLLRQCLTNFGEQRHPHIRHHFHEKQRVAS